MINSNSSAKQGFIHPNEAQLTKRCPNLAQRIIKIGPKNLLIIHLLAGVLQILSLNPLIIGAQPGNSAVNQPMARTIVAPYAAFVPLTELTTKIARIQRQPTALSRPMVSGEFHPLPKGRAPYRPSALLLTLAGPQGQNLDKLKQNTAYLRMHKTHVYYLFTDLLRHLNLLVDRFASKKMDLESRNFGILQTLVKRVALKNGKILKLKWPLVLLNPQFLREILSSPTFLVMLFHAVEVAYSSLPSSFWLKPAMKMVAQPSVQQEERSWWRRKRIYESLNGRGSSELQPNLRTVHFKEPGEPSSLDLPPRVAKAIRGALKLPPVNPNYYQQPREHFVFADGQAGKTPAQHHYHLSDLSLDINQATDETPPKRPTERPTYTDHESADDAHDSEEMTQHQQSYSQDEKYEIEQEAEENKVKPMDTIPLSFGELQKPVNMPPSGSMISEASLESGKIINEQIMSPSEFNALDPKEKDFVIRATKQSLDESKWTNELIRQHSELVESIKDKSFQVNRLPAPNDMIDR